MLGFCSHVEGSRGGTKWFDENEMKSIAFWKILLLSVVATEERARGWLLQLWESQRKSYAMVGLQE